MSNPDPTLTAPAWTPEALARLERAPVFLRGMVRRLAEKKARELGENEITVWAVRDRSLETGSIVVTYQP